MLPAFELRLTLPPSRESCFRFCLNAAVTGYVFGVGRGEVDQSLSGESVEWLAALDVLWEQRRLADSAVMVVEGERRFGLSPLVKLCQAQQLVLELSAAIESASEPPPAHRERALALVAEATAPEDIGPDLLLRAAMIAFDLDEYKRTAQLIKRLPRPPSETLDFKSQTALCHLIGKLMLQVEGHREQAEEQLLAAVTGDPANPRYWHSLAEFLIDDGRLREARGVVEVALRGAPGDEQLRALSDRIGKPRRIGSD